MLYERSTSTNLTHLKKVLGIPRLFRHRYSTETFLENYRRVAQRAAKKNLNGLRKITPHLLRFISDEKTLHAAYVYLKRSASHAPGPDGLRYGDMEEMGVWKICRELRDEIRQKEYVRSEEHVQKISKGPGRGFRELTIQSILDRIVQRAIVEILQPLFDPLFDPHSFGYRPQKGHLKALACAEQYQKQLGCKFWVSVDIKNAFPNVPVKRLLAILRKYLPDDDLMAFLEHVIEPDQTPGLRQGSPLSPLLLNLYLHHNLDRPWRKLHPKIPLIRFADDILVLCKNRKEANAAYGSLRQLLQPAGFTLKEDPLSAIHHLAHSDPVQWMGFEITPVSGVLRYSITEHAWDTLGELLETAQGKPLAPISAVETLVAWISAKGPCYRPRDCSAVYKQMESLAASFGFTEILTQAEMTELWQLAYARWCKMRQSGLVSVRMSPGKE